MARCEQLEAALRDLDREYDYQVEENYCICGSDDMNSHSMSCERQMEIRGRIVKLIGRNSTIASETPAKGPA